MTTELIYVNILIST